MFSRVVTPERTMEGTYFRSDEKMERYMVTNSKGSFLASDMEDEEEQPETAPDDSLAEEEYVRPAAQKHRKY